MKPLCRLTLGAGLVAMPLVGGAIPGYVTTVENGVEVVVRTHTPDSGIHECWHTSDWTKEMAIVGCDGKVAEIAEVEVPPPLLPPMPPMPDEPMTPPAAEPCEEHLTLSDDGEALFAFNKARLSQNSMSKLDVLIDNIKSFNVERIMITGHADRIGKTAYNERLSRRRAEAVRDYLLDRQVAQPEQIEVEAKGESEPLVPCEGVRPRKKLIACLAPNRRVVIDVSGTKEGGCK